MVVNDLHNVGQYDLIYADPPWKQSKGGKKSVRANSSGKPLDYPTCSLDEIKEHLSLVSNAGGERYIILVDNRQVSISSTRNS